MYVVIRECELELKYNNGFLTPIICDTLEEAQKEVKEFDNFCKDYPCNGNAFIAKII